MALQQTADELIPDLRRLQRPLLVAGIAGLIVSALGGLFNPTQFFQSYLMGYMLCLGTTLGCDAVHGSNMAKWCNRQFDDLLAKARLITDQNARSPLYEEAQLVF